MLNPLDLKYRSRGFFIKRKQFNGHFLQKLVTFCNEYCYFKLFFYNDYIEIYFTNYVIPKRFSVV